MTMAWHGYKNERAYSQHGNNETFPKKHVERMSVFPRPHNFPEHAQRMRVFRLAHGSIETAKSKDSRNPLGLLSPVPLAGIAVMLRNSQN